MSTIAPIYASPQTYQSGAELEVDHQMWHPALDYTSQPLPTGGQPYNWSMESDNSQAIYKHEPHSPILDIVHPAPTRHIDARYLESQSSSQSPEMVHPSIHQPLYQFAESPHQIIPQGSIEYEYEPTQYYEAHLETSPSGYYHGVQPGYYHGGAVSYSVYSPYAHMQLPCPPSSYVQPYTTAVYGYAFNTPPETRRNSYALYTPMSSNPSSGTTSPQFEHLDTPHERDTTNSAEGTDSLPTPVTPTTLPHPRSMRMPANLLLAQSGITSEPITMMSAYHQQDAFAPFETQVRAPMHHESAFHTPAPYQPLSPVSPVLEHHTEAFPEANSPPTAVAPSTTFVAESGQADEQVEEGGESPIDAAQSQAAARLKKLRERRHVIACSFCRGRKIACHSPVRVSQETEDGIPDSVAESAQDDEYTPKPVSSSARRPSGVDRPSCDNCVRRGRECVYPPRVPRVPRRRRKTATAAPAPAVVEHQPSQYPVLSINTQFLQ